MPLKWKELVDPTAIPAAGAFLVYPWLRAGRLTLMVGQSGIGKSTLTLELIAQLLKGGDLWDRFPAQKIERVLYLHAEHTTETIQEVSAERGIPTGHVRIVGDFGTNGSFLVDKGTPTPLVSDIRALLKDFKPQLLIAEPISAFIRLSENDNTEVRQAMTLLARLGAEAGAAVLTHHHVGKSYFDPERPREAGTPGMARGAMAFEDAAEQVIYLEQTKDEGQRKIVTQKLKGYPVLPVTIGFNHDTLEYTFVPQLWGVDVIGVYNWKKKHPGEPTEKLVEYFTGLKCKQERVLLALKRAKKLGLV